MKVKASLRASTGGLHLLEGIHTRVDSTKTVRHAPKSEFSGIFTEATVSDRRVASVVECG